MELEFLGAGERRRTSSVAAGIIKNASVSDRQAQRRDCGGYKEEDSRGMKTFNTELDFPAPMGARDICVHTSRQEGAWRFMEAQPQ